MMAVRGTIKYAATCSCKHGVRGSTTLLGRRMYERCSMVHVIASRREEASKTKHLLKSKHSGDVIDVSMVGVQGGRPGRTQCCGKTSYTNTILMYARDSGLELKAQLGNIARTTFGSLVNETCRKQLLPKYLSRHPPEMIRQGKCQGFLSHIGAERYARIIVAATRVPEMVAQRTYARGVQTKSRLSGCSTTSRSMSGQSSHTAASFILYGYTR